MVVRFGPFTLDIAARRLARGRRDLHLSPKAFQLLVVLVEERPNALSKAALQERLWPGTFVVEANLSNLAAEIRRTLGDRGRSPKWIRTVHGFGYSFCGLARPVSGSIDARAERPACWLEWGRRRFPLSIGEHLIGRDADVDIRLDASTVSRRHARIVMERDGTYLEDLGSKNGVLRRGRPVRSRVRLVDGDDIHIGSVLVTFRVLAPAMSTATHAGSGAGPSA